MESDTSTPALDSPETECVLLSTRDGDIVWASPASRAVLNRSPDELTENETIQTLFGSALPHPYQLNDGPVTRQVTMANDTTLSVTAQTVSDAITVYRCHCEIDTRLSFERVLSRVDDAVVAFDTEWRYTYVNDSAADLLGQSPESLLGKVAWDVFPATKQTRLQSALEASLESQEVTTIEWYGKTIDRWMEVRCFPSPTGVSLYFKDITDRKARQLELRKERDLTTQLLSVSPVGLCVLSPDSTFLRINERAETILGASRDELLGEPLNEPMWEAYDTNDDPIPPEEFPFNIVCRTGEPTFGNEMSLRRRDGDGVWVSVNAAPLHDDDGNLDRVVIAFEDITDRKADERQLAAQHEELSRLNHINELIREVNQAIVGATDRSTIERAVCEQLVQSDSYPAAMTSRLTAEETMQVEYISGLSEDFREWLRREGPACMEPEIHRTRTENTITVLSTLQSGDSERLQSLAEEYDIHAIGNVPIEHDGTVYGVLSIGARDETAFTDREQSVFLELGQLLGKAIDAIQTKKLLHASAFHELKLAVEPTNAPLVALQTRLGVTLTLDGVVPAASGRYLAYLTGNGLRRTDIDAATDSIDGIESVRVVERDHQLGVEISVAERTAIGTLINAGGKVRGATITNGVGEFIVDVTLDTNVRHYLDRIEHNDIDVELLAKREVNRSVATEWATPSESDGLTDRQRTILEAAYRSGYFEWPRRQTTGEELADSFDISSSTLHQHLRVAAAKVFEQYFETYEE